MTINTSFLFERFEIQLISEKLFETFGIVQSCVFCLTIISYSLLCYTVFYHSPKRIGDYKWYILSNATFGFLFQLASVALRPYPLLPYPILIIHGFSDVWIKLFNVMPPQILADILLNLIILCIVAFFYSTTMMFLYRYLQTTQNLRLRSFTSLSKYFQSYIIFGAVFVVFSLIPLNMQFLSNEDLKKGLQAADPETYEIAKQHFLVGFSARTGNYYLFGGIALAIMAAICCCAVLFSIFACYKYLYEHENAFSHKTAQLFKSLLNMLVIDLCVAGSTGVVTLGLSLLSVVTYFEGGSHVVLLSLALADFYPLFTHVLTLSYIEPYRITVIRLFRLDSYFTDEVRNFNSENTSITKVTKSVKRPSLFVQRQRHMQLQRKISVFFTKM